MLHHAGEQPSEFPALGGRQRAKQLTLSALDLSVELFEGAGSGESQVHELTAAIALIGDARDEAGVLEVIQHRDHVAPVDRQPAPEVGLAGRALLGERDQNRSPVTPLRD
jgi:hypothetical protein